MKLKMDLDGHETITLEASEGRITFNGQEVRRQTAQALGEAIHLVRGHADLQAAAIRRAGREGAS